MIEDLVTVWILTSVIPSHPDCFFIEETIGSVRWHFKKAPITILCDGLRTEQFDARYRYFEYLKRLGQKCFNEYRNVELRVFGKHQHQIGMCREALPLVNTPYILWLEHDCPLVARPIEWPALDIELKAGTVDFVRFLPEPQIHPEHEHLMGQMIETSRLSLRETIQFSARPHIATKIFYERLLSRFSPEANCFIEDFAHGLCQTEPWGNWKMAIYIDREGKDSKFSYHLDGRAASRKYDELQVF